jgi:hypothetical protein
LQAQGHVFRSQGDTEVLVHGYEEWGDEVVARVDGMFAFALWDARKRRLLAARDRMGKKPLYFARIARAGAPPLFAFASELKALLRVPGFDRGIDHEALGRYLVHEYVPPPHTIFRGARKLGAGQRLRLEVRGDGTSEPRVDRYWDLPFAEQPRVVSDDEAASELRGLLLSAVRRRLVADVPVGIFLSGGIDSSSVAALAAELAGPANVRTFSIGFSDASFDESSHARRVARHLGTRHSEERLDARVAARRPAQGGRLSRRAPGRRVDRADLSAVGVSRASMSPSRWGATAATSSLPATRPSWPRPGAACTSTTRQPLPAAWSRPRLACCPRAPAISAWISRSTSSCRVGMCLDRVGTSAGWRRFCPSTWRRCWHPS